MNDRQHAPESHDTNAAAAKAGLFPPDFLWGAATSAYQIEGFPLADGAGPSIWHRFSHTPGRTNAGDTGDRACEHYKRWREDVALMADLGLGAYRFSISWSRIQPGGRGAVNAAGLAFYDQLVDGLLARGIQPNVTLYHWDLPAALDELGGWCNREIVNWFAEYASILFRALGDRVPMWATLNEPWVVTDGGYLHGVLAPGHRGIFEPPLASHHLLLAHAAAVEAYRSIGREKIGLVVNLEPKFAASGDEADLRATKRADAYMNRQYLDPVMHGRYPEEMADIYGEAWPSFSAADLARIRQPIDFLGINYYTRSWVKDDPSALPPRVRAIPPRERTIMETKWEVYPDGLREILEWVQAEYGPIPLYVTENGGAFYDPPKVPEGGLVDPLRVDCLRGHLRAIRQARANGVDLRGYFVWSLLDNFEWSEGFSKRFGIVHVDYETQVRTPKASAQFYREVIRSRGGVLG